MNAGDEEMRCPKCGHAFCCMCEACDPTEPFLRGRKIGAKYAFKAIFSWIDAAKTFGWENPAFLLTCLERDMKKKAEKFE